MMVFRQNVKFLLRLEHTTQVHLAQHLGIDNSHLNHFLNYKHDPERKPSTAVRRGKRKDDGRWLSAKYFDPISDFFGVELWMLFRDDLRAQMLKENNKR